MGGLVWAGVLTEQVYRCDAPYRISMQSPKEKKR